MQTRFLGRTDLETLAGIPDVEAERKRSFDEGYCAGLLKAAEIAEKEGNSKEARAGIVNGALITAVAIRTEAAAEKEK